MYLLINLQESGQSIKYIDDHQHPLTGAGTRGSGGRRCPPGALREGPEWGTFWQNDCQISLKTRLECIKITLKVNFYKQKNLAWLS